MLFTSALVALGATLTTALTPLEVKGNAFVNPDTGNKFQIVGIDYQINGSSGYDPENGHDPLSVGSVCLRDAAIMQSLGVNAIRVYNLDPSLNHDECASIFNAAGMYMLLDVNSPLGGESIRDDKPAESYHKDYLTRTFAIVEAFKNYPNTLLFFSGNEIISSVEKAETVPQYLRAVTRDLKNYIANNADRTIPVGYSAADVRDVLWDTWNYLQCTNEEDEGDDMSRVDIFGLNSYSWCGDSSFEKSTFDKLVEGLKDTSVPVFFSEYGCNEVEPRPFTEVASIYGDDMNSVFSGGLVYEFSQEDHKYGLVQVYGNGSAHLLTDYDNLSEQYAKLDMDALENTKPGDSPKPPKCSKSLIKTKGFDSNFTIPAPPKGVDKLIKDGIPDKPSGKIIDIDNWDVKDTVWAEDWSELSSLSVKPLKEGEINKPGTNEGGTSGGSGNSDDDDSAGVAFAPAMAAVAALPLLAAALFN